MANNADIMKKIHALCRQYLKHLDKNKFAEPIRLQKKKILNRLLYTQDPTEVIRVLGIKNNHPTLTNYSQVLRQSRTPWLMFLLKGFGVFFTFPLSLPILMLWSFVERGTINFLKTDGSILVDEILILYEQRSKSPKKASTPYPFQSQQKKSKARFDHKSKPSAPANNDSFFTAPLASSQNQSTTTKPNTIPKPTPHHVPTSAIPEEESKPFATKPATFNPPFSPTKPQSKPKQPSHATQGKPNMMSASETPNHANTFEQGDAFYDTLASIAQGFQQFFWDNQEAMFESDLKRLTGDPIIIASRVRPTTSLQNYLLIDVYCSFKWSNQPSITSTFKVLTQLEPILSLASTIPPPGVNITPKATPASVFPSWSSLYQRFFHTEPTFHSLMKEGDEIQGVHTKENFYLKAYAIAKSEYEKVTALEALINLWDHHHEFIWSKPMYKALREKTAKTDFHQLPLSEQEEFLEQKQKYENWISEPISKLKAYTEQLPTHYREFSLTANQINSTFKTIIDYLQNNQISEAWIKFNEIPKLSAFIKRSFPNLNMMWHQIDGIFQVIDADGYACLPYKCVPLDSQLRRDRLSIYAKDNAIWCATINRRQGNAERFIIEKSTLGEYGDEIFQLLDEKWSLKDHHIEAIYSSLASKGYYSCNETGYSGASIENALYRFNQANEILEQYHQCYKTHPPSATAENSRLIDEHFARLKAQLQHDILTPLQAILDVGDYANKHTPYEERRRISKFDRADIRRRLLIDDFEPNHQIYEDEEWDVLLNSFSISGFKP